MKSKLAKLCRLVLSTGLLALLPLLASAQSLNLDLGEGPTTTARIIQLMLLITVLSLAPSILVMVTSFTRIIVVLSFLRSAIGIQQTPPNVVLVSLALFLTFFIMQPTMQKAWDEGIRPMMGNEVEEQVAFERTISPFHVFMLNHTRKKDLELFAAMAKVELPANAKAEAVPIRVVIPAFMISELRRAFEIGFLIFLPFLIIDMVIASILMAMGMMMLPPSVVSLPFKIIFFVLIDGWYLIAGSLVKSYG
jgi:flagellar biosynthetic protein FliP